MSYGREVVTALVSPAMVEVMPVAMTGTETVALESKCSDSTEKE